MLELAKELASFDQKYFCGWIIAGLEAHVHGNCERFEKAKLAEKAHSCVLEVCGYTGARQCKSLRVTLVLPKNGAHVAAPAVQNKSRPLGSHTFTRQDIDGYIVYVGDKNIIHKGENAIVPGLCMLAWLQRELSLPELDWRVRFSAPVHAGDKVDFYSEPGLYRACVGSQPVFAIKM